MNKDSILLLLLGLFFSYLGYIFKVKKKVNLISGIDASKVKDVNGLANWAGSNMFLLAVLTFLMAALQFFYPNLTASIFTAFGIIVFTDAILTVVVGRKYINDAGTGIESTESEQVSLGQQSQAAQLDAKERTPLERVLEGEEEKKGRL